MYDKEPSQFAVNRKIGGGVSGENARRSSLFRQSLSRSGNDRGERRKGGGKGLRTERGSGLNLLPKLPLREVFEKTYKKSELGREKNLHFVDSCLGGDEKGMFVWVGRGLRW